MTMSRTPLDGELLQLLNASSKLKLVKTRSLSCFSLFLLRQDSFGSSTSPANNKKAFSLLVKFLTDIVPFESANNLRVHILKPPFIPAKCNLVYSDYTILAKTKLADLNVSYSHHFNLWFISCWSICWAVYLFCECMSYDRSWQQYYMKHLQHDSMIRCRGSGPSL
jgi:hypothetical protein